MKYYDELGKSIMCFRRQPLEIIIFFMISRWCLMHPWHMICNITYEWAVNDIQTKLFIPSRGV